MTKNSSNHDVKISARVVFSSSRQARVTMKALIPDNVNLPEDLTLSMFSRGNTVHVVIGSRLSMLATATATLDEILEHLSLSRKVMSQGG